MTSVSTTPKAASRGLSRGRIAPTTRPVFRAVAFWRRLRYPSGIDWPWLVIVGLAGVALGGAVAVGAQADDAGSVFRRLARLAAKAVVPLAIAAVAAAAVWALVLIARADGDHDAGWAQAIAAAALLLTTLLLYATGSRRWTATAQIVQEIEGETVTIAPGAPLSNELVDKLDATNKQKVQVQRGPYFRALYTGLDGRWSTSKVQALLWTYAVLFALVSLFVAAELGVVLDDGPEGFSDIDFHEEYLLLLGGPFAAAVLTKGIMTTKVENGTVVKPAVPADRATVTGLRDLITDDAGRADLVDFQYFFFNLAALGFFAVRFLKDLESGFPTIPEFLVGLTSASALAYVTKKAVERSAPQITRVSPSRLFRGEEVAVHGQYLVTAEAAPPAVTVDGRPARAVVMRTLDPALRESRLKVTIPADARVGTDKELAVLPDGATVPATGLVDIVEVTISAVDPSPLPTAAGTPLVIKGSGFGAAPGSVSLGGQALTVTSWTDDRVAAQLSDNVSATGSAELEVRRGGDAAVPSGFRVVPLQ